MSRLGYWIALLPILAGCGARYEVMEDLLPPDDPGGRACIARCEEQRKDCEHDCERQVRDCEARAEQRTDEAFPQIWAKYRERYEMYLLERAFWLEEKELLLRQRGLLEKRLTRLESRCASGDMLACGERKRLQRERDGLQLPERPEPLVEPTREALAAKYRQACQRDCGCQAEFRSCFLSCGGEVHSRRVCVANCDDPQ